MSGFHEVSFPFSVALGARGGPVRHTEIVTLGSGQEERNTPHAHSRRRWNAGPGVKTLDDLHTLTQFFEARRGRLHGFRFRDPLDHKSCAPSASVSATDQLLGTGDGETTEYSLVKHYASGGESYIRPIVKPVDGSVRIAVGGMELDEAEFAVDPVTGLVSLVTPPMEGATVMAGFEFDCPVRFDSDALDISLDAFGAGEAADVPLIELRL